MGSCSGKSKPEGSIIDNSQNTAHGNIYSPRQETFWTGKQRNHQHPLILSPKFKLSSWVSSFKEYCGYLHKPQARENININPNKLKKYKCCTNTAVLQRNQHLSSFCCCPCATAEKTSSFCPMGRSGWEVIKRLISCKACGGQSNCPCCSKYVSTSLDDRACQTPSTQLEHFSSTENNSGTSASKGLSRSFCPAPTPLSNSVLALALQGLAASSSDTDHRVYRD